MLRGRISYAAIAAVLVLSAPAMGDGVSQAQAQAVSFETSDGQVLEFRPVETLSCKELDRVLTEISGANYRSIGSTPPNHPGDRALYDYEDRASRRLSQACGVTPKAQSFGRVQRGSNWEFGRWGPGGD